MSDQQLSLPSPIQPGPADVEDEVVFGIEDMSPYDPLHPDEIATADPEIRWKAIFNACRPVSLLPDDVLELIFEAAAGPLLFVPRQVDACLGPGAPEQPLTLAPQIAISHVCRRWRRVALCTWSLWTKLSVSNNSRHLSILEQLVTKRAKLGELDVTISHLHQFVKGDLRLCGKPPFRNTLSPVVAQFLRSHLHRIRALTVEGCMFTLCQLFDTSYPRTESLTTLNWSVSSQCSSHRDWMRSPLQAPNLRKARGVEDLSFLSLMNTSALTHVTLRDVPQLHRIARFRPATQMLQRLAHLPNVEYLDYESEVDLPPDPEWNPEKVPLHKLRSLTLLVNLQPTSLARVLPLLDMPLLTDLRLDELWYRSHDGPRGAEVVRLLQAVPTVVRLQMELDWATLVFVLRELAQVNNVEHTVLLPLLEGLQAQIHVTDRGQPFPPSLKGELEELLRARTPEGTVIKLSEDALSCASCKDRRVACGPRCMRNQLIARAVQRDGPANLGITIEF